MPLRDISHWTRKCYAEKLQPIELNNYPIKSVKLPVNFYLKTVTKTKMLNSFIHSKNNGQTHK